MRWTRRCSCFNQQVEGPLCSTASKETFRYVVISLKGKRQKPFLSPATQGFTCSMASSRQALFSHAAPHHWCPSGSCNWEPVCTDRFGGILREELSVLTSEANAVFKR